jgi:hypothetical protein
LWRASRILPPHDEGLRWPAGQVVVDSIKADLGDGWAESGLSARAFFQANTLKEPRGLGPTSHREGWTPQRLALARKPAIRYDTLPDVRQALPPP